MMLTGVRAAVAVAPSVPPVEEKAAAEAGSAAHTVSAFAPEVSVKPVGSVAAPGVNRATLRKPSAVEVRPPCCRVISMSAARWHLPDTLPADLPYRKLPNEADTLSSLLPASKPSTLNSSQMCKRIGGAGGSGAPTSCRRSTKRAEVNSVRRGDTTAIRGASHRKTINIQLFVSVCGRDWRRV